MSAASEQMADMPQPCAVQEAAVDPTMYDCEVCGAILKELLNHVSHKFALHYPPLPRISPGLGRRSDSPGHAGHEPAVLANQPFAHKDRGR